MNFTLAIPPSIRAKPAGNLEVCAGGFLVKKNKYLFGKRSKTKDWAPGLWDIAGGRSLKNEHPLLTLQREILEETSARVMNAELLVTADVCRHSNGEPLFKYYIYMVTHFKGKVVNNSDEHTKLEWFTREELDKLAIALPAYLTLIDEWIAKKASQ